MVTSPMIKFPALTLTSTSIATSYSFRPAAKNEMGWAVCTVNDHTCELNIQSDWGDWSYGWGSGNFGDGITLTGFIGTRTAPDYLAGKLQKGDGRRWSAEATVAALRKRLCEMRLRDGRGQIENRLEPADMLPDGSVPPHLAGRYDEQGLAVFGDRWSEPRPWATGLLDHRREQIHYLSRSDARRIWDDLGGLCDIRDADYFLDRVCKIDSLDTHVTDEPWDYLRCEQTMADRVLKECILPALIAACRATSESRASAPKG